MVKHLCTASLAQMEEFYTRGREKNSKKEVLVASCDCHLDSKDDFHHNWNVSRLLLTEGQGMPCCEVGGVGGRGGARTRI